MKAAIKKNIGSVLFLLLGVFVLAATGSQVKGKGTAVAEARLFPQLMAWILIIFSSLSLLLELLRGKRGQARETEKMKRKLDWKRIGKVILVSFAMLFWLLFLDSLGFMICTAVLTLALTWASGNRKPVSIVCLIILVPLVIYFVFSIILNTRLPEILF